jgi:adenylyltransferase/sulfurtransferase
LPLGALTPAETLPVTAPLTIPADLLRQCFEHGRQTYPDEACGYLSGPESEPGALTEAHPIPNIQNRKHAEDPQTYPRTAREGYILDPSVCLALTKRFRNEGRALRVIYHTHPDVGAYFSAEDQLKALWNGQFPIEPGVIFLVCGVKHGEPDGAILAWWTDGKWEEHRII